MTNPQPAQFRKERSTPANDNAAPLTEQPVPTHRAWCIIYVPFEDGPGGGFQLREMHMPREAVDAYTKRSWAPELMAVTVARLNSRVHATVTDVESADRDTY